jgi:hypothetical protein
MLRGRISQGAALLERTYAECLEQGKGLVVAGLGLFDLRGNTKCGKITEEAQSICLRPRFWWV